MFKCDLVIVDDLYPHPVSINNWRGIEFRAYMDYFKKVKVYTNLLSLSLVGSESIKDVQQIYRTSEYASYKVKYISDFSFPFKKTSLFYAIFLNNIYACIPLIEKYNIPFVFTLYPGGGFGINDSDSDNKLKRVMSSKQFQGVICNSCITKKYFLDKKLCSEDSILYQNGIIMDETLFNTDTSIKQRYGFDKNTINIKEIDTHFTFHGIRLKSWFDEFYQDKDLFISPNRSGSLAFGAFDGFPTTTSVDAMLRKVGVICGDDFNQNDNQFESNKDILILEHVTSEKIVEKIKLLYNEPSKIQELGEKGYERAKKLYSYENQIIPRIKFIEKTIERVDK